MGVSRELVLVGVWQPKVAVVNGLLRGQLAPQLADGYRCQADLLLAAEDRVVAQVRGSATTVRGDDYANTYCLIFRLVGDSITEVIEHCDTSLVDRVLVPPTPGTAGWAPSG